MKSKEKSKLQKLSLSIGDFIRYWGFRRIHGAIWTQLYVSNSPLSCTNLTQRLKLSKALISPALDELVEYKLIKEVPGPNSKTKLYIAEENINEVIQHVLKVRETKMLDAITNNYASFAEDAEQSTDIDSNRVKSLGDMIIAANLMLELLKNQKDIMKLPMELDR